LWLKDLYRFVGNLNQDDVNTNFNANALETNDLPYATGYFNNRDSSKEMIYCGAGAFESCASLAGPVLDVRNFEWTWQNFTLNFPKDGSNTLVASDNSTGGSTVLNVTLDLSHGNRPTHVVKVTCLDISSIHCGSQTLSSAIPVEFTNTNGEHIAYASFQVVYHLKGMNYVAGFSKFKDTPTNLAKNNLME
jgi:hypothetical protein